MIAFAKGQIVKRILIIGMICTVSFAAYGAIYTHSDPNGETVYSDTPLSQEATPLDMGHEASLEAGTLSTPPKEQSTSALNATTTNNERKPYQALTMLSPKNKETIANQPTLTVRLHVEPALQEGDVIQLFLDGAPAGPTTTQLQITVPALERGSHTLKAVLLGNKQQSLIQTDTITIYIQRISLHSPARQHRASIHFKTLKHPNLS